MNYLKKILFKIIPSDHFSSKYPISIKGIIIINKRVVLLKNERNEWELPGGKIEIDESPEECLIREIKEELSIVTTIVSIVDVWMYNILEKVNVLIITYHCNCKIIDENKLIISKEHKEVGTFSFDEVESLNMPKGYKNSIVKIKNNYL